MSRFVASLAVLLLAAPLGAQSTAATTAATAPAAPVVATPGARQAAQELLRLMDMEKVVRASVDVMLDLQMKQQPMMAPYRSTMQAWANQFITFAEFEPGMSKIYTDSFTEAELRDLIAFYRTPTGRKLAELSPQLSQRGAQVGAEVAAAHTADLQKMIAARSAELSAGSGAKP